MAIVDPLSLTTRFLPAHSRPKWPSLVGYRLGATLVEQSEANSLGGAHGCESPRHGHRALPCLSHVYLIRLICLCHLDPDISLSSAVTTASPGTIGTTLCRFMSWSRSWGRISFYPTVIHSTMSWSKEYELHSSLLFSIPADLVRCGLSPLLLV